MCRWFAYISPEEDCLLEDVLITPAHSLSKQVDQQYLPKLLSHDGESYRNKDEVAMRNQFNNDDGFGVAWYTHARQDFNEATGPRPAMYKHAQPPTNDYNFKSICASTQTRAVFGHIRSATATPAVDVNNHPFVFGRHAIMHNGVITDFLAIKRPMTDHVEDGAYGNIHGTTDSEHLAALYMTFLTKTAGGGKESWEEQYAVTEMVDALTAAISVIVDLQRKALGMDNAEANSLNVACTDGEQFIAFRYRNHATEQPPSLYWSDEAGVTLNRKYPDCPDGPGNAKAYKDADEHGRHVIVASEPTTYKQHQWHLVPKNHGVVVGKDGKARIQKIDLPAELGAKAVTTQRG